jgi:hypothetical protein
MPTTTSLSVQDLKLDLKNFRTVQQPNEASAISALISINPDWFWVLTESLLTDGYHPTENILVLVGGKSGTDMEVKEGNRRIAALKLIYGYARRSVINVPSNIEATIAFKHGQNITPSQRQRWAGEYNLSVLDEAIKRLAPRIGAASARDVADRTEANDCHEP